jgi:hypothetical protein
MKMKGLDSFYFLTGWLPQLGFGIENTKAGIGIPASIVIVRYQTKKCRNATPRSGTGLVLASLVFHSVT